METLVSNGILMMFLSRIILFLCLALVCGCDRTAGQHSHTKIIGGRPVSEHQPWFVQILDGGNSPEGFCGGALVAHRVVLTAAHCVEPQYFKSMFVVLGLRDGINLHLKKPVAVEAAIVHPGYKPESDDPGQNDIALLYLSDYKNDQFEAHVAPILIHDTAQPLEAITSVARVVGLGNNSSLGWLSDGLIREVDLPVLDLAQCSAKYKNITNSQICAGEMLSGGIDSCQGDSGGPLMFKNQQGQWMLAGIVSYGEGCAQKGAPGVYTRVSSFVGWIHDSIQILTSPTPAQLTKSVVLDLIKTRCIPQFDYIAHKITAGDHTRQTVFGLDRESLVLRDGPVDLSGAEMEKCQLTVGSHDIDVRWVKVEDLDNGGEEVIVHITSNDLSWFSEPMRLKYRQDRVTCQTSQGPVVLLDQYQTTSVQFQDILYQLGEEIEGPDNSQTTWGCSVGDASVEIFEKASVSEGQLAVRILHGRTGSVVALLNRMDKQLQVDATIALESDLMGWLRVNNASEIDLFTWQIVCTEDFVLRDYDGNDKPATTLEDGSGYGIVFDAALRPEGTIRAGQSRSLRISLEAPEGVEKLGCIINDAVNVTTERSF